MPASPTSAFDVEVHALYALSAAVLGVVAFIQPRRGDRLPLLPHLRWLALFGVAQAANGLHELWHVLEPLPDRDAGVLDLVAALPLFEFTRRCVADHVRGRAGLWPRLSRPWIHVPVVGMAVGLAIVGAGAGVRLPMTSAWTVVLPGALGAGFLMLCGPTFRSPVPSDRRIAIGLAAVFVTHGLATVVATASAAVGAGVHASASHAWFEGTRAVTALCGALGLAALVGRRTRETLWRERSTSQHLTEVLGTLEQRVAARTDELHRANQALATLRYALDSSINAFCIVGLDGRVHYANPAFAALWEVASPSDAIGRLASDFAFVPGAIDEIAREVEATGRFDGLVDIKTSSGRVMNARAVTTLVRSPAGEPLAVMGAILDVTEARETAAALEREREFARRLLGAAPAVVVVLSPEGRVDYVNPAYERLTGQSLDAVRGRDWLALTPAQERDRVRSIFQAAVAGAGNRGNVHAICCGDGTTRSIDWSDDVLRGPEGAITAVVAVGIDVTERLEAEAKLLTVESRTRQILDSLFGYIGVLDLDGTVVYVNRTPLEVSGLRAEDVLGRCLWDSFWFEGSPSVQERVRDELASASRGETARFEVPARIAGGDTIVVDVTFGPIRDPSGEIALVAAFGVDVTERVRAAAALEELNLRKRSLLELAQRLESAASVGEVVVAVERELSNALGYGKAWLLLEEPDGASVHLVHTHRRAPKLTPDAVEQVVEVSTEELGRRFAAAGGVCVFEDLAGSAADRGVPVPSAEARTVAYLPITLASRRFCALGVGSFGVAGARSPSTGARDYLSSLASHVSATVDRIELAAARAWAERAAFESQSRYRRLHDSMMDAFAEADLAGRIRDSNRAFREMLGYEADELAQLTTEQLTPERWHEVERRILAEQVLRLGHSEVYQKEFRRKDGSVFPVELRSFLLREPGGEPSGMCAIVRDVTGRMKVEEELRRSLAEKETLLREVHHRVKNNLQVISSVLHFQSKRLHDPRDLAVFAEGRDRLRSMILVHQKLYQANDLSRVDFAEYVQTLVRDLQASHSVAARDAHVRVTGASVRLPIEKALPLGMIICELVTNAFKYAFPSGSRGTLEVRLRPVGERIEVTVADDGVGLPAGLDAEHGGAFGWQLVRNLTRQLDGDLSIERDGGTAVRISCRAAKLGRISD